MFPCKADLEFYQSKRLPKWALSIRNVAKTSIDPVVNAHGSIRLLTGECSAHNLIALLGPYFRAKAPATAIAAYLEQIAANPQCAIAPKRRAGFARKWAARLRRRYHVAVKNERTGKLTLMTLAPVTHDEGCVILRKLAPHKDTRALLIQTGKLGKRRA
jgi:hypothetical protein